MNNIVSQLNFQPIEKVTGVNRPHCHWCSTTHSGAWQAAEIFPYADKEKSVLIFMCSDACKQCFFNMPNIEIKLSELIIDIGLFSNTYLNDEYENYITTIVK